MITLALFITVAVAMWLLPKTKPKFWAQPDQACPWCGQGRAS